jgi:hypothetical protein
VTCKAAASCSRWHVVRCTSSDFVERALDQKEAPMSKRQGQSQRCVRDIMVKNVVSIEPFRAPQKDEALEAAQEVSRRSAKRSA